MVLNLYQISLKDNIKNNSKYLSYSKHNSNKCGKFCILFIKANILNEPHYIKFLLQFH